MAVKDLGDVGFVKLAVSKDHARPVLESMHVDGGTIACTDGHRLHVAHGVQGLADGMWHVGDGHRTEGTYPNWRQACPDPDLLKTIHLASAAKLLPLLEAAATYEKRAGQISALHETEIPVADTVAHFSPRYLFDAVRGMPPMLPVYIGVQGPLAPIAIMGGWRYAVVMPARTHECAERERPGRFNLGELLSPVADSDIADVNDAFRRIGKPAEKAAEAAA